jgi:hypothetical protein
MKSFLTGTVSFIKQKWKRNIYFRLTSLFILFYFTGTYGIYIYERDKNPAFNTLYESCWSTLVYILSGFDVGSPQTVQGRFFSILILMSSIGMLGMIIGQVTSILLQRRDVKMPKNISKHIVICNWNEKGEKIIEEIHSPLAGPQIDIIVISNPRPGNEEELRNNFPKEFSNVEFREGHPILHETLKRANAHMARSVIILTGNSSEPDSESALTALVINTLWKNRIEEEIEKRIKNSTLSREEAIKKIEEEEDFRKPRIIVEVLEHRKMQHLRDAGADDIICAADYAIGILAQSALNEKLSDVYHDLLTYREHTTEIYIVDNPEVSQWLEGKSFIEVSTFLLENRCKINPAIPIGYRKGKEIFINPKEDIKFTSCVSLIVMAYELPDLLKLINKK